ncbi:MAG: aldo/keto reductase [Chthonomonadaceae bacterium]|nr:aldo/keto reductase [Chthonomonadaceae bacterium]
MLLTARFGKTDLKVTRLGLGGFPFGGVNEAAGWNPFTPEGRATAISTIRYALECGINYFDTAPGYGEGNSESIYGEALEGIAAPYTLATKCPWQGVGAAEVRASVEASLRRLRRETVDVVQFHGGMFTEAETYHILEEGPLEALTQLRAEGKVRFLGFSCEEPFTALPLLASGVFDVVQLRYNLLNHQAAEHALPKAKDADVGVAIMRPMTSGILQRILRDIAPAWLKAQDPYEVCLRFVLSDPRAHTALVGARWPHEIDRNMRVAEAFHPEVDLSVVPLRTAGIYKEADELAARANPELGRQVQ